MSNLVMAKELEEEVLRAQINDKKVKVTGSLFNKGIEIGIPGEEPLCVIVPNANHRVKRPTAFGYFTPPEDDRDDEQVQLVSYIIRSDIHATAYERGGDWHDQIDVMAMFNERLYNDTEVEVISYSTGGVRVHVEHDGELHVLCGKDIIANVICELPRAGKAYEFVVGDTIQMVYCGMLYTVNCPELTNANEIVYFVRSMIPSIAGVAHASEHGSRQLIR